MARRNSVMSLTWLPLLPCLLLVPTALAQETSDAPSFPSEASAITVDVVVLDDDGQPVRGLSRDDFTLREDGREQTLVGFEARDVDLPGSVTVEGTRGAVAQVTADNSGPAAPPGRVFALLIDDLGISPPVATQLKPALAGWLQDQADPRDEITIMTTSGDLWWSDVVGRGRGDLLTVLDRFGGKRLEDPQRAGGMSEWEAYRIVFVEEGTDSERADTVDGPTSGDPAGSAGIRFLGNTVIERVAQRFYDAGLCHCVPYDCNVPRCFSLVRQTANAVHEIWRRRAESVYGAIGRLSRSLEGVRGRKSILLVSEDFIQDTSVDRPFRSAIDASQKANTAIYFLGARGLTGLSFFSVAQGGAEGSLQRQGRQSRPHDIGMLAAEEGVLATGGAENLADATGGSITRSNDLAAGLERMVRDSTAYYLLGYQPESPPDGMWHDIDVDVDRPGVRVLARKGYVAARLEDVARDRERQEQAADEAPGDDDEKSKRPLAPTLLAGSSRGGLPLRLAAYVQNNDGVSKARVRVVVEIDNTRVRIDRVPDPWRATLDFTLLAAGLEREPLVPFDERLHMSLSPGEAVDGWWLVPRDVWLPPGVTQLRVFVRDVLSGVSGLATLRLVVPDVAEPYLSTPLLTDRAFPSPKPGEVPELVPTAHRRFEGKGPLYCQYELFTFGGETLRGVPQLIGSYLLQGPDGRVVSADQPTLIETDGRRAVRRIVLPADKLEEGSYDLAITVEDRLARHTLTARVPFVIERDGEGPARESP